MLFVVKCYKAKKKKKEKEKEKVQQWCRPFFKVWLVLSLCVIERQFTEFRFLSGQYN